MYVEGILGNAPNDAHCLVLVLLLKVGIPLVKINIFQRFKYRLNSADSAVLTVFETLKNIEK